MTAEPCKLFFKSTETFRHVCRQIQNKRLINLLRWAFFKTVCVKAFTNLNRNKNLDSGGMSTEAFGGAWLLFPEVLIS